MKRLLLALVSLLIVSLVVTACAPAPTATPVPAPPPTAVPAAPATAVPPTATTAPPKATTAPAPAPAATVAPAPAPAGGKLKAVLDRKKLICGINGSLVGFSTLAPDGNYVGFDADFCRVLAAALFGDVKAVEFRKLNTTERFAALQSGEVDVVFRNTTDTLGRDTQNGVDFGPTTFYDGGGMMVPKKSNITKLEQLNGATICVLEGTTNVQVLADVFKARNIKYTAQTFKDAETLYKSLDEGRCDAATSDKSQLAGQRASLVKVPADYIVLDETMSKEPLTPMVGQNDSAWRDVVTWVVYATFYAEEVGITSKNADTFKTTTDPNIMNFFGLTNDLPKKMGLPNDAFFNAIKLVGNYGEIYERSLIPLGIPRGLNALYTKGGLIYAPPLRP
jgi:general L-amino acid transport system substrate-binding protein